jgi:ribosome assembly protein YihI (activator of Der GTPase)
MPSSTISSNQEKRKRHDDTSNDGGERVRGLSRNKKTSGVSSTTTTTTTSNSSGALSSKKKRKKNGSTPTKVLVVSSSVMALQEAKKKVEAYQECRYAPATKWKSLTLKKNLIDLIKFIDDEKLDTNQKATITKRLQQRIQYVHDTMKNYGIHFIEMLNESVATFQKREKIPDETVEFSNDLDVSILCSICETSCKNGRHWGRLGGRPASYHAQCLPLHHALNRLGRVVKENLTAHTPVNTKTTKIKKHQALLKSIKGVEKAAKESNFLCGAVFLYSNAEDLASFGNSKTVPTVSRFFGVSFSLSYLSVFLSFYFTSITLQHQLLFSNVDTRIRKWCRKSS